MNKTVDYETWAKSMVIDIQWGGREWHNFGTHIVDGLPQMYLEDWINGERLFLKEHDEMPSINIPVDVYRFIPYGNRNYSPEMWPEYKAIGADKWRPKTFEELGWTNPPPPLPEPRVIRENA